MQVKIEKIDKEENFDFSKNTTYQCGGKAKIAYFPKTLKEYQELIKMFSSLQMPYMILGNGSNILVSDYGYEGAVIVTKNLDKIEQISNTKIAVECGCPVGKILNFCYKNNFGGLEFLIGIPGTSGGLTFMNGGAGGVYVGDRITGVNLIDQSGNLVYFSNEMCKFAYKSSIMQDINYMVYNTIYSVYVTHNTQYIDKITKIYDKRKKLPKLKNCGCVFKNPSGLTAGKLLESCGLKGFSMRGAHISSVHANFIISDDGISQNVYNLIQYAKLCVYEKFGIQLEEEVKYVGEFDDEINRRLS